MIEETESNAIIRRDPDGCDDFASAIVEADMHATFRVRRNFYRAISITE